MTINDLKIALAHDSFTQLGGAERFMDVLHEIFPDAVVYTLVIDSRIKNKYREWRIQPTWLQIFYNLIPKLQYWLCLIPFAVFFIRIRNADLVITSSSGLIKNLRIPKNCIHINYCHTPPRFLWVDNGYLNQEVSWVLRPFVKFCLSWIKKWDLSGSKTIDYFIANSQEVKKRIKNTYFRESEVIYPPVNLKFWKPTLPKSDYFLVAGRLQAHKKIDWVVEIFNELGLPLHVVGTGRQLKYLQSMAKSNIKFFGQISDNQLRDEYSGAKAFIYPQIEDFGLMPLEAAACHTATIAYGKGGVLETVVSGATGEFFHDYNPEKFKKIIMHWQVSKYKNSVLVSQSTKFDVENFKNQILSFLNRVILKNTQT